MFRLWGKIYRKRKLSQDMVVCDDTARERDEKIQAALEEVCRAYDLAAPLWLDLNRDDMARRGKCRFNSDNFVEEIDFDYLEIQIIEEDEKPEGPRTVIEDGVEIVYM